MYGTALCFLLLAACGIAPADLDTGSGTLPRAVDESVPPLLVSTVPDTVAPEPTTTTSTASTTTTSTVTTTEPTTTTQVPVALGGAGTTVASTTTTTSTPTTTTTQPAHAEPADDSFDGDALGTHWSVRRPDAVSLTVTESQLLVDVETPAPWTDASTGFFLHQSVHGDSMMTATVRVRRTSDPEAPLDRPDHLGGLLLRDPASEGSAENHVSIAVGTRSSGPAIEWTTTTDSETAAAGATWLDGDAELRICRRGPTITVEHRAIGTSAWVLDATIARPGLPPELDAGIMAAAHAAPDLRVLVDEIAYGSPDDAGCP